MCLKPRAPMTPPPKNKVTSVVRTRSLCRFASTGGLPESALDRFQKKSFPSSIPMSVTMPVTCVVRISAFDNLVTRAFCKPMMKQSTMTVAGTNSHSWCSRLLPSRPKHTSSVASSMSGNAYSLCRRSRRPQLTRTAEHAAPARNDSRAPRPSSISQRLPRARLSAMADTTPDMCEVYWCTARKPPALVAPAIKAR
ncbi:hypothetical protein D3C81_1355950 [compost metagenome]